MTAKTLVLWDIDLTLVDYSGGIGVGRTWYTQALANLHAMELAHLPNFPGCTERAITSELLAAHGLEPSEEDIQRMFDELVSIAAASRPNLATLGHALPGAAEVLTALGERPDVVQSLVTGNLSVVAGYKLEPFGLHEHVDFDVGGYGSISLHRHDLVSAAMELAAGKYGGDFAPTSVVVIGDTPNDVQAGLHHGTVAVGVATGGHSVDELNESGAHAVLPDLADTDAVLDALLPIGMR